MPEVKTAARPAAAADGTQVLSVRDLQAWYGESHILHGINFHVYEGEEDTLLRRNGAGKTSTMKSEMGSIGKRTGAIQFNGNLSCALRPDEPSTRTASIEAEHAG